MAEQRKDTIYNSKKCKPNCFVSIPIRSEMIKQNYIELQNKLIEFDPEAKSALCSPLKLHITLLVALINEDSIQLALSALKESAEKVGDILSHTPLELNFRGLGKFNKNVLFMKVEDKNLEVLNKIAGIVYESFLKKGVQLIGNRPRFQAHMTVAKSSRTLLHKVFSSSLLDQYCTHFGEDKIHCLELLRMDKPDTEKGYYFKEGEYSFTDS